MAVISATKPRFAKILDRVAERAGVMRAGDPDAGYPVTGRKLGGGFDCFPDRRERKSVCRIDESGCRRRKLDARQDPPVHPAAADMFGIVGEARHAVRRDAVEIGPNQGFGNNGRDLAAGAGGAQNLNGKFLKLSDGNEFDTHLQFPFESGKRRQSETRPF